jgi:hypothetical protein
MYTCIPYPYEHLRETKSAGLKIGEVTTCVSLSTETSSPTKKYFVFYETPKY